MSRTQTFFDWLAGVGQEPLFLCPKDHERELRENNWNLAPAEAEHAQLDATTLTAVLTELVGRLAERAMTQLASAPVTFYAWYEQLTGQLRCAIASQPPSVLPFGQQLLPVTAETVATAFFAGHRLRVTPSAVPTWVVPLV